MKPNSSSEYDEQERAIIKLLKEAGSLQAAYPRELLTARRAAFLAQAEQLETVEIGKEVPAADQEIVKLLENLKPARVEYPAELLVARRSAFLAQVERLKTVDVGEEVPVGDQEIVNLLENLGSARVEYPANRLAATRSAFLRQVERAGAPSLWDGLRISIQRIFQSGPTIPAFGRISLVVVSLIAAALLGSLFFSRMERSFEPSPSQAAAAPTQLLPAGAGEVAIIICKPEDQTPSCPSGELTPGQDLAQQGNGTALPAVSKDAQSRPDGAHKAAYVNDGRGGTSWVSNSTDSWIKIDLGKVTTINTVSLQKGNPGSSLGSDPGQFVIAVALTDVYEDGDSGDDYVEYERVFHSEQTGFSGTVSHTETITTRFLPVQARFVKITFERAGAAIQEVGVFMVQPPLLAAQSTGTPSDDQPEITLTPAGMNTPVTMGSATPVTAGTWLPTDTAVSSPTLTGTPIALPTHTLPVDTATAVPTVPLPSDTPIPFSTAVPATAQPSPASTGTIVVTGSDQILTFTCTGNAAEIRGHGNIITLLGSCSSITVTGNGNRVFWQSGSPVITNRGKDNIISQL